jgi:hypothetical protein
MEFKSRSEIRRLAITNPGRLAEELYKAKNQLKTADELIKKINDLHARADRDDYNKLIKEIRHHLANYIDWYHNEERYDDKH